MNSKQEAKVEKLLPWFRGSTYTWENAIMDNEIKAVRSIKSNIFSNQQDATNPTSRFWQAC